MKLADAATRAAEAAELNRQARAIVSMTLSHVELNSDGGSEVVDTVDAALQVVHGLLERAADLV